MATKRVNPELFNILKSLVDVRVPGLRSQVNAGAVAETQIPKINTQISDLRSFIETCRYDRADAKETEAEISDNESKLSEYNRAIVAANFARSELNAAARFYQTYNIVTRDLRLATLRRKYDELDARMDVLDELIFGCEINMDSTVRSSELCEQAANDMNKYSSEYDEIIKQKKLLTDMIKSCQTK